MYGLIPGLYAEFTIATIEKPQLWRRIVSSKFTQFLHITKQISLGSTFDFWDVSSEDDQSPATVRLHNSRTTLDETYWLISTSICLVRAWRVRKQKTLYRERLFSVGFILSVITTVV